MHGWAIPEWSDPNDLRGCGFFHILSSEIAFQHGYFDQLSFSGFKAFQFQRITLKPNHFAKCTAATCRCNLTFTAAAATYHEL